MTRTPRRAGAASVSTSFRRLVEAVAFRVVDRVRKELPDRGEMQKIQREIRRLARRVEAGLGRRAGRRVGRPRSNRRCKVRNCELAHVAKGFCSRHYQAWRRKKTRGAGRRK